MEHFSFFLYVRLRKGRSRGDAQDFVLQTLRRIRYRLCGFQIIAQLNLVRRERSQMMVRSRDRAVKQE